MSDRSPLFNQSVEKVFSVLMAFGAEKPSMSLPEIAEAAGISKSSAQRFAYTLETLGFLKKDALSKKYRLSPKVLELGFRYIHADPLVGSANPYLADLNIRTKETVNLWRPDETDMICISRFASYKQVTSHMPLGKRLPMYCTSAGRAYLSALPAGNAESLLRRSSFVRHTPHTIVDADKILRMIEVARHAGFAHAYDEYYRQDIAISAPIIDPSGQAIGAINVSVPITRWPLKKALATLPSQLMETARAISSVWEDTRDRPT